MTAHNYDTANEKTFWRMIKNVASHHRRDTARAIVLLSIQAVLLYSLVPYIISRIIAEVATGTTFADGKTLLWLIVAMVATIAAGAYINKLGFRAYAELRTRLRERLELEAADALLQKDHKFYANQKVGSLTSNFIGYVEGHTAVVDVIFLDSLTIVVSYGASLIIIGFMAPFLLPFLLALTASFIIHAAVSLKRRTHFRLERKKQTSSMRGYVADVLGNSMLVKVFGTERRELKQIRKRSNSIGQLFLQESIMMVHDSYVRIGLLYGFQTLTIIGIILLAQFGTISLVVTIFTITYLIRTANDIFKAGPILRTLEQAAVDASPMLDILNDNSHIKDLPDAERLHVSSSAIDFHDVTFSYEERDNSVQVFNKVSFSIHPGERVGLVGPSGGGKSTVTKLLLRFLDIQGGSIKIDDQSISAVTQESLRRAIAYVPQEPFLFHRTLRENIAYGKPDANQNDIKLAAERAHAMDFIGQLPKGLDTIVGERGVKLSGGQKQRIAIARAILKDAPILLLDEATSALDSDSERLVQAALDELMQGRTALVIAHRLSTIQNMDRIIVIDNGKIVEEGSHSKLLANKGMYARLWARQSGGFIDD